MFGGRQKTVREAPTWSHILETHEPCPMSVHCLRLLPGDDLILALRQFCVKHEITAATIVSAVGSTSVTVLRPAGRQELRIIEDDAEIISLTGTLDSGGEHLHLSVSLPECQVLGGHMMQGCIVRTTAEVVLGVIKNVEFKRSLDVRTGHMELSINPKYTLGEVATDAEGAHELRATAAGEEQASTADEEADGLSMEERLSQLQQVDAKFHRKARPPPPR